MRSGAGPLKASASHTEGLALGLGAAGVGVGLEIGLGEEVDALAVSMLGSISGWRYTSS
jgi:hypothetical protein